jgi:hypothetical protein
MIDTMTPFELAALIWPGAFTLSAVILFLLLTSTADFGAGVRRLGVVCFLVLLAGFYLIPLLRLPARWLLTLVGMAAPAGLSLVSIRMVVKET